MKFVIHRQVSGFYHFTLINESMECIYVSPIFKDKAALLEAIESHKEKMLNDAFHALRAKTVDESCDSQ